MLPRHMLFVMIIHLFATQIREILKKTIYIVTLFISRLNMKFASFNRRSC